MLRIAGRMALWLLFMIVVTILTCKVASEFYVGRRHAELIAVSKDLIIPGVLALIASVFAAYLWDDTE
jgi:hypothetical protein